jgi:hypothetical protein
MSTINKDLQSNIAVKRVVSPVAIGTTGTGKTGKIIDRRDYGGVEFIVSYGTVTATNAVFTVVMKEGDVTGTLTSVADADMIGTEALAGLAAGVRTSGTTKNVSKRVGYKGIKRYVQLNVSSTVTAGTPVGIDAVLFNPNLVAAANPSTGQ